jgi:hypothetical protein
MDLQFIDAPVTTSTSAYTANRVVGGAIHLRKAAKSGGVTLLRHLIVREVGSQKAPFTLVFLNADPGVLADGSTPSLSALYENIVGKVDVANGDYETVGGVSIADIEISRVMRGLTGDQKQGFTGGDLWVIPVVTGTPTYSGAHVLGFGFGFMRD